MSDSLSGSSQVMRGDDSFKVLFPMSRQVPSEHGIQNYGMHLFVTSESAAPSSHLES